MARRNRFALEAGDPCIGLLRVELHFPTARSLKAKRMAVNSIKDRLRKQFNVSVAETGYLELWQRCQLSCVCVSGTRTMVETQLEAIDRELEERFSAELVSSSFEVIA